jgi:hypothetical protein
MVPVRAGRSARWVELVTAFPTEHATHVATVNPATGQPDRTVAQVPASLSLDAVDAAGTSLLMQGPLAGSTQGWDLYRVDIATPEPIQLAANVQQATWLPA